MGRVSGGYLVIHSVWKEEPEARIQMDSWQKHVAMPAGQSTRRKKIGRSGIRGSWDRQRLVGGQRAKSTTISTLHVCVHQRTPTSEKVLNY